MKRWLFPAGAAGRFVILAVYQPALAVAAQLIDQRQGCPPHLGQRVLNSGRDLAVLPPADDTGSIECTQPPREDTGAHAGRSLKLVEATASGFEITQDEERPVVAEELGGARDRAVCIGLRLG